MPAPFHTLLRRQLKRCFGQVDEIPPDVQAFVEMVNVAYEQADTDRRMLERSLDLSSEELGSANAQMHQAILELQAAHRDMEARVVDRTQALESAHEQLRQATKMEAVGQLAGGVAHDFNNLLTVIGGCIEILFASSNLLDADHAELDEIRKATQRATALTQQLLAFSRRQVLEPKTVDLNQIAVGLQTMLARVIREDITVLVDSSPGPAWVRLDPSQIERVILNLALNARDALPQGGNIRLSVSRMSPASSGPPDSPAADEYICLRISDDGIGMTPEVRARVFEPFFTTKEAGKGTGLGLASVYGIVQQSNGSISVESTKGVGTTFTILFPASLPPDIGRAKSTSGDESARQRDVVLLVEDEHGVRRVLRSMLQRHGFEVIEAATPAEACTMFEQRLQDIRLLVTDVVMPGMNGPALAQRLVALQPDLVVLFISGFADIDPTKLGLGHRNVGFLSKPIEASGLAAKIRELLVAS